MSEVEELANKYFEEQCEHTYADTVEQLKEDVVTAFLQGYAKGETDEKFRTKQVVTKNMAELIKENEKLKKENAELDCKIENVRYYLDHEIPHELMNEATHLIWKMI